MVLTHNRRTRLTSRTDVTAHYRRAGGYLISEGDTAPLRALFCCS